MPSWPSTKERAALLSWPLSSAPLRSSSPRAACSAATGSPRRRPSYRRHRGPAGGELRAAAGRHQRLVLLGAAQVGLRPGVIAAREQGTPERERELGRRVHAVARHRLEDGPQRAHLAVDHHLEPARGGELGGEIPGVARGGVAQCAGVVAVGGEPRRRAPVQPRWLIGKLRAQLGAQQLGEQRVIAMPRAVLVEGRRERAALLQPRQHRVAFGALGERVGQLRAERVDDRRPQQEVAHLRRLSREHLADQVVADRGVGAGEVLDEVVRLGMLVQ